MGANAVKKALFIILLASPCLGEGPQFRHQDPIVNREVTNIYQDLRDTNGKIASLVINLKDYGAKGDGTTDDTVAIQSWLNAGISSSTLFAPGGTYIFSDELEWPNAYNVTLVGYGAVFKLASGVNTDLLVSSNYPSSGGGQAPKIFGLTFDGTSDGNSNNGSIVFYGINDGLVTDFTVQNSTGSGFLLRRSSNWTFNNPKALNTNACGLCAYDGSGNVTWNNVYVSSCAPNVLMQGPEVDNQTLSLNLRLNGGYVGYSKKGQDNVQVLQGVQGFSITNTINEHSDAKGINVYSSTTTALLASNTYSNTQGLIIDNLIKNSDEEAVKIWDNIFAVKGASQVLVAHNQFYDDQASPTQTYGIALQGLANYIYLDANLYGRNVSGTVQTGTGVNTHGAVLVSSDVPSNTNFPATTQYGDLATINVPAGDWDISGILCGFRNGATVTGMQVGVGTVSGNSVSGLVFPSDYLAGFAPTATIDPTCITIPSVRRVLTATSTPIYLKFRSDYTVATPIARGAIRARRVLSQ